jgi:hypothetical protein
MYGINRIQSANQTANLWLDGGPAAQLDTLFGREAKKPSPMLLASAFFRPGRQIFNTTSNLVPGNGKIALKPDSVDGLEYADFFPVRNMFGNGTADRIAEAVGGMFHLMGVRNKIIKPGTNYSNNALLGASRYDVYVHPDDTDKAFALINQEDSRYQLTLSIYRALGMPWEVAAWIVAAIFAGLSGGGRSVPI